MNLQMSSFILLKHPLSVTYSLLTLHGPQGGEGLSNSILGSHSNLHHRWQRWTSYMRSATIHWDWHYGGYRCSQGHNDRRKWITIWWSNYNFKNLIQILKLCFMFTDTRNAVMLCSIMQEQWSYENQKPNISQVHSDSLVCFWRKCLYQNIQMP